jgi:hypothetical protein
VLWELVSKDTRTLLYTDKAWAKQNCQNQNDLILLTYRLSGTKKAAPASCSLTASNLLEPSLEASCRLGLEWGQRDLNPHDFISQRIFTLPQLSLQSLHHLLPLKGQQGQHRDLEDWTLPLPSAYPLG